MDDSTAEFSIIAGNDQMWPTIWPSDICDSVILKPYSKNWKYISI